jgi:hypothetical protein
MAEKSDSGTCRLCDASYTGKGIARHLSACLCKHSEHLLKLSNNGAGAFFHLQIRGKELPEYWMHIMVDARLNLEDLDRFLRDTWLECCGHLSAFFYRGQRLNMRTRLNEAFHSGRAFDYCYDFGKATELIVRVMAAYDGTVNGWQPLHILAQNNAPEILCSVCGKALAVKVCAACLREGKGWLCEFCADAHPCGEEIILPVLNSPRTGRCGYDGKRINLC